MDPFDISYLGALLAGALTFVSPCILPIVPAYLCFVSGASLDELTAEGGVDKHVQRQVFISSLAFVLGFGTVFVLMGAAMAGASDAISSSWSSISGPAQIIAGVVVVIFGLHYIGIFKIGFLNFDKRLHLDKKPSGPFGSFILGLAFAFGWSPCAGPILGTIIMVAGTQGEVLKGMTLLGTYAAGIGIPFLLTSLAVKPFMGFMGKFRKHMRKVEIAIGVLLIITGIAIAGDLIYVASAWILETFPSIADLET
ncbi:cytochrome c biogenesis CcdA family protein [Pseudomonadota bacterium]